MTVATLALPVIAEPGLRGGRAPSQSFPDLVIPVQSEAEPSTFANHLISMITASCLENGDNPPGLKGMAAQRDWPAVPDEELSRQSNEFTRMIGGWRLSDQFSSYAILQSASDGPPRIHVCSMTTKLPDADAYQAFRSAFEKGFDTNSDEIVERPNETTQRYWLHRGDKQSVRTSLVYTSSRSILTIRMLFGGKTPSAP